MVFLGYEWTMTHGFFAVMGGFMLFKDNKDPNPRTLSPWNLEEYLASGDIIITEAEIWDRSRGDILSKGFAILQTGWFILQCIARQVEHIPITELELVTLAFSVLNFITYGLWWNKPLSVQCAYRVIKNRKPTPEQTGEHEAGIDEEANKGWGRQESDAGVNKAAGNGNKGMWCLFKMDITSVSETIF